MNLKIKRFYNINNHSIAFLSGLNVVFTNIYDKYDQHHFFNSGTCKPSSFACMKNGRSFVVAYESSFNDNNIKIIFWSDKSNTGYNYYTNELKIDLTDIASIEDLFYDNTDSFLLVYARTKPDPDTEKVKYVCMIYQFMEAKSDYDYQYQFHIDLNLKADSVAPSLYMNPYSDYFHIIIETLDYHIIYKYFLYQKKHEVMQTPKTDIESPFFRALCFFKYQKQVFVLISSNPKQLNIHYDNMKIIKQNEITKTYASMMQYKDMMLGIYENTVYLHEFNKKDRTFNVTSCYDLNMPIPMDLGSKILITMLFEPPEDEFNYSYFILATKQGHLFKMNTHMFNIVKNDSTKDVEMKIHVEQMFDKLVVDQADKISICRRKTQFLTSSSRNDICVKSFSNENYIYKMLDNTPLFLMMHPLGYNVIIAYKKEIQIVSILLQDFLLMNTIKFNIPIVNCKVSESGKYIAVATKTYVHLYDFYTCNEIEFYRFKLPESSKVSIMTFGCNDTILLLYDGLESIFGLCLNYIKYGIVDEFYINIRTIKIPRDRTVINIYYFKLGEYAIIKLDNDEFYKYSMFFDDILYLVECQHLKFELAPHLMALCYKENIQQAEDGPILQNYLITTSNQVEGYLVVYKNYNINTTKWANYTLIPAHASSVTYIDFCPADNMLYSMGLDGVVIQWKLAGFTSNYQEVFLEKEFIVGQSFLDDQYNQEQRLQKKSEDTKKELEQKFKNDFDELKAAIERLKEERKAATAQATQSLHDLETRKEQEKQELILKHSQQAREDEAKFNEHKVAKKAEIDRKDKELEVIIEERKKKESEKNLKIKGLTNKYTELIKKITSEYNATLQTKDEEISKYRREYDKTKKDLEEMTATTNQMKEQSYQDGFNESIKQIEFLQREVLSCKNQFAAANTRLEFLEDHNQQLLRDYNDLNSQKAAIYNQNVRIQDVVNFLDAQLKEKNEILSNYEREISERDQKLQNLNNNSLTSNNEIYLLQQKNEELRDKYKKLKEQKKEQENKMFELQMQGEKYEKNNKNLDAMKDKLHEENTRLKMEKNDLVSRISRMKTDIDKALQKCKNLEEMREVILDMCINYLWNDYIFDDEQQTADKDKVRTYAFTYYDNRKNLDSSINDIATRVTTYKDQFKKKMGEVQDRNVKAIKKVYEARTDPDLPALINKRPKTSGTPGTQPKRAVSNLRERPDRPQTREFKRIKTKKEERINTVVIDNNNMQDDVYFVFD